MEFNLYLLCQGYNKGSIKAVISPELKDNLNLALKKIKEKKIRLKYIAKNLDVDYTTLWKNLSLNKIPLEILKELETQSSVLLQKQVTYFYSPKTKSKIRIPKQPTESLAKLIGCIIADGHLRTRKSGRGNHYELIIREGHKDTIQAAKKWFQEIFEIIPSVKKAENHFYIYLSNKIIHNFFTKIINLPQGKKTETVSTPNFILNSSKKIKRSYLQGLFMFDGGVDYRAGYVNYTSKSKRLVKEIITLLKEINLEPDYISFKPDKYNRYKIRIRKREKLEKALVLFQKDTEKWWRLNEHLYGLKGTAKDLKTTLRFMDNHYPRVRKDTLAFSDVIKALKDLDDQANILSLSQKLDRNKTVVYGFLKKLEHWEIISSYRVGLRKHYKFNKIFKIPWR